MKITIKSIKKGFKFKYNRIVDFIGIKSIRNKNTKEWKTADLFIDEFNTEYINQEIVKILKTNKYDVFDIIVIFDGYEASDRMNMFLEEIYENQKLELNNPEEVLLDKEIEHNSNSIKYFKNESLKLENDYDEKLLECTNKKMKDKFNRYYMDKQHHLKTIIENLNSINLNLEMLRELK